MPKVESLAAEARVIEALPNAMFRVQLKNGSPNTILAHMAAGSSVPRILPGDEVVVELMPNDTTRGRIVKRRS